MSLLRTDRDAAQRAITVVWVLLVLATGASWMLGVHETGTPGDVHPVNALLLVIAMTKVRFVGVYFMELRAAPLPLRLVFEIWTIGAAAALCAMYLLA